MSAPGSDQRGDQRLRAGERGNAKTRGHQRTQPECQLAEERIVLAGRQHLLVPVAPDVPRRRNTRQAQRTVRIPGTTSSQR